MGAARPQRAEVRFFHAFIVRGLQKQKRKVRLTGVRAGLA